MSTAAAFAAYDPSSPLRPFSFERREPGPNDVQFDILYCGVCHSDLHTVRSEWAGTLYPCVPGHEIVGKVTAVGSDVKNFKAGDTVGVDSQRIVVDEKFVLRIRHPEAQLAAVAPLLCAGITTYSPLKHWG